MVFFNRCLLLCFFCCLKRYSTSCLCLAYQCLRQPMANTFCQLKLVTKRPCSGWKKAFVCMVDGRWLNPEFSTNVHPNVQLVIDANLFLGWRHVTLQWCSQKILFSLYRLLLNGSRSLGKGFGFSKARLVQTKQGQYQKEEYWHPLTG